MVWENGDRFDGKRIIGLNGAKCLAQVGEVPLAWACWWSNGTGLMLGFLHQPNLPRAIALRQAIAPYPNYHPWSQSQHEPAEKHFGRSLMSSIVSVSLPRFIQ